MREFDYSKVIDYKFYTFCVTMAPPLRYILYPKLRVYGKGNIPKKDRNIILAANHVNAKDPGLLSVLAGPRHRLHFMGKYELFQNSASFFMLTHFNGFPIKRGQHDAVAQRYAAEVVKSGRMLGMFIEGGRSRDGQLQKPKAGVAKIAQETGASILPVSVYSESGGKFFQPMTVRFGKVIPFEELQYNGGSSYEDLQVVSDQIMDAIRVLWEKRHDGN